MANKPHEAGFTLIEIMVTVVIVGVLAGLVSMSVGGPGQRRALDEADQLFATLDYAREEASIQGEELGLAFDDDGYRVLHFDPESESWSEAERPFKPHRIADGVRMAFSLREKAELAGVKQRSGDQDEVRPEVLVMSSGEISPFDVEFHVGDATDVSARIRSDGSGSLQQD